MPTALTSPKRAVQFTVGIPMKLNIGRTRSLRRQLSWELCRQYDGACSARQKQIQSGVLN